MRGNQQRGFSLLEVLVAFAILAISLGVLMEIFSRATMTTIASSQYSRAASLVEAKLNTVGVAIPLEEGSVSGEPEDGLDWEVTIMPAQFGDGSFAEPPAIPYRVNGTALWKDGRHVRRLTLSTLRLGVKPQESVRR